MAPYHILNTKQLARMFASFNPDYIIGIPFLEMNLRWLDRNVLGLPSDLKPREIGHLSKIF